MNALEMTELAGYLFLAWVLGYGLGLLLLFFRKIGESV